MHMGDGAGQLQRKVNLKVIFICLFLQAVIHFLFLSSFSASLFLVHRSYCLYNIVSLSKSLALCFAGEVFDYLVAHGRMKEKEARAKFRQVPSFLPLQCSGFTPLLPALPQTGPCSTWGTVAPSLLSKD